MRADSWDMSKREGRRRDEQLIDMKDFFHAGPPLALPPSLKITLHWAHDLPPILRLGDQQPFVPCRRHNLLRDTQNS